MSSASRIVEAQIATAANAIVATATPPGLWWKWAAAPIAHAPAIGAGPLRLRSRDHDFLAGMTKRHVRLPLAIWSAPPIAPSVVYGHWL
jgi:hypothetical protein